jgi:hypothetical protein
MTADWSYRRRGVHLPIPGYLAVTASSVYVFSARFGGTTKIIGPKQQWPRTDIQVEHSTDSSSQILLRLGVGKPIIEIKAADPGPESAQVIRLLCGDHA